MVQHNAYIVQHVSEKPNWSQTRRKPLHCVEEPSFVLKSVSTYVLACDLLNKSQAKAQPIMQ